MSYDLTNLSNYDTEVYEFVTVGNIEIPILEDLPVGLSAEKEKLLYLLQAFTISEQEFFLRLFCAYTMHPQASKVVSWSKLRRVTLPKEAIEDIQQKMTEVYQQVREVKEAIEEARKADEVFDPIKEKGNEEGNAQAGESEGKSSSES